MSTSSASVTSSAPTTMTTSDGSFLRTADGNLLTDEEGNFLTPEGNIIKPEEAHKILANQGVSVVENNDNKVEPMEPGDAVTNSSHLKRVQPERRTLVKFSKKEHF